MLSVLLLVFAIVFVIYGILIKRKIARINDLTDMVYTKFIDRTIKVDESRNAMIDALSLGIGSNMLNLIDIYSSVGEHQEVLDIISQRYPSEVSDFTGLDWFKKVSELDANDSMTSYISAFKGQVAENLSLDFLKNQGYENVRLFDSLTHANDDIIGELNGEEVAFSVKNGSVKYIKSAIADHPSSTNYIINDESYSEMLRNGDIHEYASKGIVIHNGGYSLTELTEEGKNAFTDLLDSGSVLDDVPWIAFAIFGVRTLTNIKQYKKNSQSSYELGINVAVDAGRVATGGVTAVLGAHYGAALGTMVAPGLGSIVGAGIGVFVGALAGGKVFNIIKEKLKWGEIIDALDYFGEKYKTGYSKCIENNIRNDLFNYEDVCEKLNRESALVIKYKSELSHYRIQKPSLEAVMVHEYYNNLVHAKNKIELVSTNAMTEVSKFVDRVITHSNSGKSTTKKMQEISRRISTNVLLRNRWLFKNEILTESEKNLLKKFDDKILLAPNHPYELDINSEDVFKGIIYKAYDDHKIQYSNSISIVGNLIIWLGLVLVGLSVYFYFN